MLSQHLDAPDVTHRQVHPFSVLLVEDDDVYATYVAGIFERIPGSPIELVRVRHLSDVIPALARHRCSVVLLDLELPDGNGLEWLHVNRSRVQAATVVITAHPEPMLPESLVADAQDFLVKSQVTPDHLVRSVRYAADRERVRQQLLRSREYFQALVEQAKDLITVVDERGIVMYESPASLHVLGRSAESCVGRPFVDMVMPADMAAAAALLREAFDGLPAPCAELRLRHADGTSRILDVVASRLPALAESARVVLNARDVTDRRHAEEALTARDQQLRQATKMEAVGRLAGGIAHDFRNVLTVITGAAERMRDSIQAAAVPSLAEVETILSNCERAASLTRQLLAFSRQQTLDPRPLDFAELIDRMADMLRQLIGEHIALRLELEPDLPAVEADPVQIEQVLMNLAINARDAMPNGGTLLIRLLRKRLDHAFADQHPPMMAGEYIAIEVSDTGCGMPPEVQARAFEPFFTTKGLQGTGLGLSTVYGIIKQSGGFIWIDSAPGHGTTFTIFMPPTSRPAVRAQQPALVRRRSSRPATILLTEDDDEVRCMVAELLRAGGHTVLQAEGPDDALLRAAAFDGHIDLLLTDIVMPGGTGRDLARRFAEVRPDLKVLFISGYPEYGAAWPGATLEPGVPFLPKPFTRDVLLHKIDELLS